MALAITTATDIQPESVEGLLSAVAARDFRFGFDQDVP
jgi:hypothetical protein